MCADGTCDPQGTPAVNRRTHAPPPTLAMDPVGAALTAGRRHADAARGSLARVALGPHVPADETAGRLAVAAADLDHLRLALNSTLEYQVLCPVALPAVPAHLAEFMRTRPEPAQEDAEAAALARDAALGARREAAAGGGPAAHAAALHAHNAAVKRLAAGYADAARLAVARIAALTAPPRAAAAGEPREG